MINQSSNTGVVVKNKRGRPKKTVAPVVAPLGIRNEPSGFPELDGNGNIIELIHFSYTSLQKLVNLASKMKCEYIQFIFTPFSVEAVCEHSVKILYEFKLDKMYRYYCDPNRPLTVISLNTNNLQKILSGFKKTADNLKYVALIAKLSNSSIIEENNNTQTDNSKLAVNLNITVVYTDGRRSSDRLDIAYEELFEELWDTLKELRICLDDYGLICRMNNNWIKDLLTSATKNAKNIMFEKLNEESDLVCSYTYKSNKGTKIIEYPNNESDIIHNGELVVVNVEIEDIKQLSKIKIADSVTLYLSNNKPFVIFADVDGEVNIMIVCK